jgi:Skp family chaperone for outer membrane proteins
MTTELHEVSNNITRVVAELEAFANELDENESVKAQSARIKAETAKASEYLGMMRQEFAELRQHYDRDQRMFSGELQKLELSYIDKKKEATALDNELAQRRTQLDGLRSEIANERARFRELLKQL